jgi:hypothetical protein
MSAVSAVLQDPRAGTAAQQLQPKALSHDGAAGSGAPWLIARGASLEIPRLDRVVLHHVSFGSDSAAARFATILLELGIASPADWKRSDSDPTKFLRRAFDRFIRSHVESEIDGAFGVSVTLSTDPHEWCETEDEPDGSQIFLYLEAASCGFVNLGPALVVCEEEHPRLPATFARLFLNGIGSCFRIYDDRDAEEHLSYLEDNYDPQEDAEALAALPDRKKILSPCMKRRPLGRRSLKAMLPRMAPGSPVARLLRATLELARVSDGVHLPEIPEPIRELFSDCNPPVPVLLAVYQLGDAVEACFDDQRQSMLEATPEPWPLIPFDGTNVESTRRAFECLGGALDILAATRRVLDLIPGWEPIVRNRENGS